MLMHAIDISVALNVKQTTMNKPKSVSLLIVADVKLTILFLTRFSP